MPVSLREVARQAGVSNATVSRVLTGANVQIAPETRQRVKRVAAELGYQPNRTAQALVTGRTQSLALWAISMRSSYSARVISHVREEVLRHKYDLMISGAEFWSEKVLDTSILRSWPVDGILSLDPPRGYILGLEKSLLWGKAFVSMGGYVLTSADYVRIDFRPAVEEAVRYLHTKGCRRIAYLVPDWFEWFSECGDARLQGYDAVMADLGHKPEYIVSPDESRPATGAALTAFIQQHGCPDGLFCFNDDMAIGAFRALRDLGYRVPDDVALVGCDGIEDMKYHDPRLATIAQPVKEMCAQAWAFLERRIREPEAPLQQAVFQPQFVARASARGDH